MYSRATRFVAGIRLQGCSMVVAYLLAST